MLQIWESQRLHVAKLLEGEELLFGLKPDSREDSEVFVGSPCVFQNTLARGLQESDGNERSGLKSEHITNSSLENN